MKKKILCMTLAIMMSAAQITAVSADIEQDLIEDQAWNCAQLDALYTNISVLWTQKHALEDQIASLNSNLVDVIVSIDLLNNDIAAKQADIDTTALNLTKAEKARDKQYEAMKKRIQYLYEKGGNDAWFQMMLGAESLSELLSKAEYTQKMYDYDRESLETYVNTINQVKDLQEKYIAEKSDLEAMQQELTVEQSNLEYQIAITKDASYNCDDEIAYAYSVAADYEAIIYQQQVEIERLEAERIAAEEAERAEAMRIAQEEAAYNEQQQSGYYSDGEYMRDESGDIVYDVKTDDYGNAVYDEDGDPVYVAVMADGSQQQTQETTTSSSSDYDYDEYGNVIDTDNTVYTESYESSSSSSNYSSGYSSSGSSVVDYATQFVGNPYVWGGTSLTNGADCSGFVQSVYSNFGVSLPRTSYEQQNAGYEVSYADAQPGDLICYGGHVAIYMGNGQIVHASNSRDGIKISNNAAYRTILSVRRLV
ncbi:MAG: C40 family peptidase [Clostridiales bacterium]|nr:C40 family peptidase [Candidatus Blautia equi]